MYQKNVEIFVQQEDSEMKHNKILVETYYNLAGTFKQLDQNELALKNYSKVIKLQMKLGDY